MPRMIKEDLAHLIRRVVKEKNLKLRDIAHRSGGQIAQSYVSRLMTGNVKNLTVEKLVALARGLDIDPHAVLAAAHGHQSQLADGSKVVEEMGALEFAGLMRRVAASPDLIEVMKSLIELGPEQHSSVLKFIASLTSSKKQSRRGRKTQERNKPGG
ncbi:MAG TPA: XRE family transcriptional regulator [Blastocatellia bacterium]|nr:XRE family transcriptional regulator [Blastocatellia bacterium]